jgi:hypothetical protein
VALEKVGAGGGGVVGGGGAVGEGRDVGRGEFLDSVDPADIIDLNGVALAPAVDFNEAVVGLLLLGLLQQSGTFHQLINA